jgi:tetratricopeptide (TPR) repeat protein
MNDLDNTLTPKDKINLIRLKQHLDFADEDFQQLFIISSNTKNLNELFYEFFTNMLPCINIQDIKNNLFTNILSNINKYKDKYILIDLFDIKEYENIRDEFQFKRDQIPDKKLKFIFLLNPEQYESFKVKAYDFFSFSNFNHLFEDHSYNFTFTQDLSKLDNLISKYEKIKNSPLSNDNRIKQLFDIASLAYDYSQFNLALEYYQEALKLSKKIKNKYFVSVISGNIGLIYSNLGEYKKALSFQLQSLKIAKQIENIKGQATTLGNIGEIYIKLDDKNLALRYINEALNISKVLDIKNDIEKYTKRINNIKKDK